ncbi:DUF1173 family protein [Loktanella sp. IMCC34160]|uniref:DUF1173 family protein n=1 Tax=Loktanella sp. IMCC34160 TaxID=2510646 RepID=UPI0013EBB360|nr:DUF1173 family protein [Loktanella sp. IMCC34160]
MQRFFYRDQEIDPETEDGQILLGRLHGKGVRLICACSPARPEMYLAKVHGLILVKRMPESGAAHAPDCPSFAPPEGFSGRGPLQGTAIEEQPEDGTTRLKLDFPLSKGPARDAPPPASGAMSTEVTSSPRKLGLTGLLHYLWEEAALHKWVPAMRGKRNWGVVRSALLGAAEGRITKSMPLATRLFIPEPFSLNAKAEIAGRRSKALRHLYDDSDRGRPFGILIAEYKDHTATARGAKFTFKHLSDLPLFAPHEFLSRFEKVASTALGLRDMVEGSHIMTLSTFSFAEAGYPILHQMGLMLVTGDWLPFEHIREAELIEAMQSSNRAFLTSLRYDLPLAAPKATMLATDLDVATLMFASRPGQALQLFDEAQSEAQDAGYETWVWAGEDGMPALPRAPSAYGRVQ